jgi:type IV secretory pathway VirB4 component
VAKYSLGKLVIGSQWLEEGAIANSDGSISKAFEMEPLSSGGLEESFNGPLAEQFYAKLADLLTRLPNNFEGQILFSRRSDDSAGVSGLRTRVFVFEKATKIDSYSHISAIFGELKAFTGPLSRVGWNSLLSGFCGSSVIAGVLPDMIWEKDCVLLGESVTRVLSLTELPQLTWKGCLQPVFEHPGEFTVSLRFQIPDRARLKRQLETKRRVSHAMAIASSVEVRNIESNSVLSSSEETLERILVEKETLFEISLAVCLHGGAEKTLAAAREMERLVSGVGNAGLFMEGIGSLPVLKSHIPGNKLLGIRKLPILSGNLSHLLPIFLDFSRCNDASEIPLRSRSGEVSTLNFFSKENMNYNALICGASGSGKSFLMNAILSATLKDEPSARLCIFDIGGSYRKIIAANGGKSTTLSTNEASALISSFLQSTNASADSFFCGLLETLCGSGSHITHSHRVAIGELLRDVAGGPLKIRGLMAAAGKKGETFYKDIAHWLKPHAELDDIAERPDLLELIRVPVAAFDFKKMEGSPVLQKTTILLLTKLLWRDLEEGKHPRTLVVFDEVWRFFAQSKEFLEELYRTLRKYRAGVCSVTQNIADYGDEAFAKMIFSTSCTKLFLQAGASADFLRNTLDLPESDIQRALSVASKKPLYSEFFALTPKMSQVFRLYPTREFYDLANTENIVEQ